MGVVMTQPCREAKVGASEDSELCRRFAQGDVEAFDRVVRIYGPELERLIRRLLGWPNQQEAQDALQEVLMNAFVHCRSFRGQSTLLTWLKRIAINTCRTFHRRRVARVGLWERFVFWRRNESPVCAGATEADSTSSQVQAAVRGLGAKDREIIILHYLEDQSVSQIAEMLQISAAAIHVRLHRARQRLADRLGPLMEDRHD
jgi:RNA polymerase sigma factor (sigma-70 family)